ncbi:MAG: hypothetical protein M3388_16570 [Acidobacteriota bacterium]|nr:hypothetical protein [Acidobacteriota bacterium]
MEEAYQILDYLPLSFKTPSEEEYIRFLWDSFEVNYNAEKYPFAFIAFNMLYMSFLYFEVWQIKVNRRKDFEMAMVGFNSERENTLLKSTSPFTFGELPESSFFRFLKILNCENDRIGNFAEIIDHRNNAAHSNGNIFFNSQIAIDEKISEVVRHVQAIQTLSKPIIETCFIDFLKSSWNADEREYFDDEEQIREALVHKNYLSQKDINSMRRFRISSLEAEENFEEIKSLFYLFRSLYKVDDETDK